MIYLAAPKGLGDAIYLRAIVLHLLKKSEQVVVFSKWPEVFADLDVEVRPLSGVEEPHEFKITPARYRLSDRSGLTQFELMCRSAGLNDDVPLRLGWSLANKKLVDDVVRRSRGRKIMLYQPPKFPRNPDQALVAPSREAFFSALRTKNDFFRVRVGHPGFSAGHDDDVLEHDLFGLTSSVTDLFDLALVADHFFSEPCYMQIMAQAVQKPFTCMFSQRGLRSENAKIAGISPDRIFHRGHLGTAIYD